MEQEPLIISWTLNMSGKVETTVKGFNEAMYTGGQKALLEGMRLPSEEPSARSG